MEQIRLEVIPDGLQIIPNHEANSFVTKHHYLKRGLHMAQLAYGHYQDGRLNGVFMFGYPYFTARLYGFHPMDYLEFARCIWMDKSDRNFGTRIISQILKRVADDWVAKYPGRTKPLLIVSYADLTRHTGTLYRACNFIYTGDSRGHKNMNSVSRPWAKDHPDRANKKARYIYPLDKRVRRQIQGLVKKNGSRLQTHENPAGGD
jgi:hypothetical protein